MVTLCRPDWSLSSCGATHPRPPYRTLCWATGRRPVNDLLIASGLQSVKNEANIHRRHPSEPAFCTLLFQANRVPHLDKHEPTNDAKW